MSTPAVLDQSQEIAFTFFCAGAPPDALRVLSFSAEEAVFGLSRVDVRLIADSAGPPVDLHALNDMPATLTIHHRRLGTRHLSGVVATIAREGTGTHATAFSLTLMPALHRLGLTSDCRIFQQISVPDIIRKILGEHGVTDAKLTLSGTHLEREY